MALPQSIPTPEDDGAIPLDRFGLRLAALRSEMGLNVKQIAERCGLNPQSWTNWERGDSAPRNMEQVATTVADVTGYSRRWLTSGGQFRSRCFATIEGTDQAPLFDIETGLGWNHRAALSIVRHDPS